MRKIVIAVIAAVSVSFLPGIGTTQAAGETNQTQIQNEITQATATKIYNERDFSTYQGERIYATRNLSGTLYRGYLHYEGSSLGRYIYSGYLYRNDLPLPITS